MANKRDQQLIRRLIAIQEAHQWSDSDMADRLAISRPFWIMVKSGERNPGYHFLRGALSAFPEVLDEVLAYFGEEK